MKPPSAAMFSQPSMVNELVSLNVSLSVMLTRRFDPSKLNACPTLPGAYAIPNVVTPLLVPALSRAFPSPRHHPTIPAGGIVQLGPGLTVRIAVELFV